MFPLLTHMVFGWKLGESEGRRRWNLHTKTAFTLLILYDPNKPDEDEVKHYNNSVVDIFWVSAYMIYK